MRRGQMKMADWVSFSVFGRREHTQGADMNIRRIRNGCFRYKYSNF